MTRKKQKLWLHRPKPYHHRKNIGRAYGDKFGLLRGASGIKGTPKTINTPTSSKKHYSTPAKTRTPKRRKLSWVTTPRSDIFSPPHIVVEVGKHVKFSPTPNVQSPEQILLDSEDTEEDCIVQVFKKFISKLRSSAHYDDFLQFMKSVNDETFPLENLAFVLFMETVRFFSTGSTSEMRYSEETKLFWKTGYRLFHAKFLYFMGGPKNIGQISGGEAERGQLISEKTKINFAIPSINILSDFNSTNLLDKVVPPGILTPIIDTLPTDDEYMLCADAKKVTAGIDTRGGDVDMFGYEGGITLAMKKERLETEISSINDIRDKLRTNDSGSTEVEDELAVQLLPKIRSVVKTISKRLSETRDLAVKQTFGLNKFKGMGGESWKDSRYVYVISGLQASLYRLREFSRDALTTIGQLLSCCSFMQKSNTPYAKDEQVDFTNQPNIALLRDTPDTCAEIEPRFVKQRSEIWHLLRKKARVTGSTMHSAIGLRGLKEKKNHFAKFIDDVSVPFTEETIIRMDHGVKHEPDATATIVGRVLPCLFPRDIFVEEGCYILPGDTTDVLCVVSPDGSIRSSPDGIVIAAIEIKCPFPSEKQTPVHYKLPEYYVCQCLAEMYVLKTDQLLYVTYSCTSTTVLKVTFSQDLWQRIWDQVLEDYDKDNLLKPTRNNPNVKSIKADIKEFVESNVEFLCEIPSCSVLPTQGPQSVMANENFVCANDTEKRGQNDSEIRDLMHIMDRATTLIGSSYDILRQRATEVMVWVLTNKNRNSSLEIPCSVPVAFGLKDYRLTSDAMRSATDHVLRECQKSGIKILSFAADGQWIQLMTRDSKNQPLTILQFHKDMWNDTKSISKQELVKKIAGVNKCEPEDPLRDVKVEKLEDGVLEISTASDSFSAILTPSDKRIWLPKKTDSASENEQQPLDINWLPEAVLNSLRSDEEEGGNIHSAILEVSHEIQSDSSHKEASIAADEVGFIGENSMESTICHANDDVDIQENDVIPLLSNKSTVADTTNATDENRENVYRGSTERQATVKNFVLQVDEPLLSSVLQSLQSECKTSHRWEKSTTNTLRDLVSSTSGINTLTHADINVVYSCIECKIPQELRRLRKSWKKDKKVDYLAGIFGYKSLPDVEPRTSRRKNPSSLQKLAMQTIQSKRYPKLALRAAYARYQFNSSLCDWQAKSPFACPVQIEGVDETIPFWFSYPEKSEASGDLLCKSLDCSHNFTHLRVRTSTVGLGGVSSCAWRECAKSNETDLTLPLVEDLIDKQSVPNARTHFSYEVEQWMLRHGYVESARLTKLIREWYDACDTPGIPATERVVKLIAMRQFLLKNVDFSQFPPAGRYINGIPTVTYEGLLIDIDTKLQMYNITDTFNIRSVGSLAAETTVGVLQDLYPTSQVSIKARDVPSLMRSVVDVMACKCNPQRYVKCIITKIQMH